MKKLHFPKSIFLCSMVLFGLNAYSQSGSGTLTPRETIAKILELNEACENSPGCWSGSANILPCSPGQCVGDNTITKIAHPGDVCDYSITVKLNKFDSIGNPICCEVTHSWFLVHCP